MRNAFKRMLTNLIGSRKFMIGIPILIILLCAGKLSAEFFIVGFLALFATNSYDKKKRLEHNESN